MYQVLYKQDVLDTFQTKAEALKYKYENERLLMEDDYMVTLTIEPVTMSVQ